MVIARHRFRLVVLLGVVVAAVVGLAAPASAHAALVGTEPASQARLAEGPDEIVLRFDEPVEATLGGIRLYDSNERRLDVGEAERVAGDDTSLRAEVRSDLGQGLYVVTWRALSADGHPVAGAFTFQVGDAASADTSGLVARLLASEGGESSVGGLLAVARFAGYVGLALLLGGFAFMVVAWPAGARRTVVHRLLLAGWGLVVVSAASAFALQGPYATARPLGDALDPSLWGDVAGTRFGTSMLLRLAAAVAALVLVLTLRHVRAVWWQAVAATVAVVLAFSVANAGHAGTGRLHLLGLAIGAVHVAAMSVWLGGLVLLAVVVLAPVRTTTTRPQAVGAAVAVDDGVVPPGADGGTTDAVRRFSRLAFVAMVAVVVTGVLQSVRILDRPGALLDTDYGRLLALKTLLVLAVLAVAGLARRAVHRRWPPPPAPADGLQRRELRQIVGSELLIGAAVLAVTAVLVGTSPTSATAAISAPFNATLVQGDALASVSIEPARRGGGNELHLYVSPPGGSLARVQGAEARLTLPSRDLGPIPVPLAYEGVNHFAAYDVQLPYRGTWQLEVVVATAPGQLVRFSTPFEVR